MLVDETLVKLRVLDAKAREVIVVRVVGTTVGETLPEDLLGLLSHRRVIKVEEEHVEEVLRAIILAAEDFDRGHLQLIFGVNQVFYLRLHLHLS